MTSHRTTFHLRGARLITTAIFVTILLAALAPAPTRARPALEEERVLSREKRLSDQRLAELETLVGLQKMKGALVTVPIAFGKLDPLRIGRRRRSLAVSNAFDQSDVREIYVPQNVISANNDEILSMILEKLANRQGIDDNDYPIM